MLARLAGWSFAHRGKVVVGWIVLLAAVHTWGGVMGSQFADALELPASGSATGFEILEEQFPQIGGGFSESIVFETDQGVDDPAVRAAMTEMFDEVGRIDHLKLASPYAPDAAAATQVNADRTVAFAMLNLDRTVDQTEGGRIGDEIAALRPDIDGLRVEVGGQMLAPFAPPESELIGLAFAVVVLIVAFGSVLAMGLPIAVALGGVGAGIGIVTLLSNTTTIPKDATTIGAMIGLGVGIDYALFIVTRYREGLHAGHDPAEASRRAMDTSGRAVVFAGLTVVVSLLGMLLIGLGFITGMAIGSSVTVAATMLASLTLLPALLGFAQHRIEVTRWRGLLAAGLLAVALLGVGLGIQPLLVGAPLAVIMLALGFAVAPLRRAVPTRRHRAPEETLAYRWSHAIQRRPWTAVIGGTAVMAVLAIPLFSLRLGFSDEGNFPEASTTRKAYDLLAEGFGPGFNGPLLIVATVGDDTELADAMRLVDAVGATRGVASVQGPIPSDMADPAASEAFLLRVIPETAPQDLATEQLVDRLRDDVIPDAARGSDMRVHVTGMVAVFVDFTSYLSERMVLFFGAVLALSFLLLMLVFRSLLVPLKAVIMNVISIAASYGVMVAVFQWGWGGSLLGIEPAPLEPFLPVMMFAIVFGLSMDYEVFLLSRIKEEYDRHGDARNSVADGLAATARVITAAAAIMVVVFGSFLAEDIRIVQAFGLGLSVAVLLDASLVRLLLVPATMELLGERNWWLPKWLDRLLPRIDVEGPVEVVDEFLAYESVGVDSAGAAPPERLGPVGDGAVVGEAESDVDEPGVQEVGAVPGAVHPTAHDR